MTSDVEHQLMRLLHGELSADETAEWRRRLDAEPELAARYAEMERLWSGLDLPEPAPAGPELVAAVRRQLGRETNPSLVEMWRLAPAWNRLLAAAALTVGVGIGAFAGTVSEAQTDDSLFATTEISLAESYWQVLEEGPVEEEGAAAEKGEVLP